MTKSMWTPARRISHWSWSPPFAVIIASILLGRLSSRNCNIAVGTCYHSSIKALERSGTDVGRLGLTRSRRSNSPQRCLIWVDVRTLCRSFKFFLANLDKPFLYGPRFVHGGIVMLKRERGLPQTVTTMLEAQNCLKCHCML
jgi:hypothetical protein